MDTVAHHQQLAVLAHERGDYLSAAQHYWDASNSYRTSEQAETRLKLAEQEMVQAGAQPSILVPLTPLSPRFHGQCRNRSNPAQETLPSEVKQISDQPTPV